MKRILVSNDDGVNAPGLRALARILNMLEGLSFSVSGPVGERSAQSHSISVGKPLHAFDIDVDGAEEACAVDGTPADSVMLALNGPLLKNPRFDLVVSGINRGDNLGWHVIYSGTVGAAREAACKGIPAMSFSLADHKARSEDLYLDAAKCAGALVCAALTMLPVLSGVVVNVNFPPSAQGAHYRGIRIASQGIHCSYPQFQEIDADKEYDFEANGHGHLQGKTTLRTFTNRAGYLRSDDREGTDSQSLSEGWVTITPISPFSDVPLHQDDALNRVNSDLRNALEKLVMIAANSLGIEAVGYRACVPLKN